MSQGTLTECLEQTSPSQRKGSNARGCKANVNGETLSERRNKV